MNTENKNNKEVENTQQVENTQVATQEQPVEQQPEKKKFDLKKTLKRVGIGLGVAGGMALAGLGGFELGKNSGKKNNSDQDTTTGCNSVASEGSEG